MSFKYFICSTTNEIKSFITFSVKYCQRGSKSFIRRVIWNIPPNTENIQNKLGLHNRGIYGIISPYLEPIIASITDMGLTTDEFRAGSLLFITLQKISMNVYVKFAGAERATMRDSITTVIIRRKAQTDGFRVRNTKAAEEG
jgi:hypothetical protein